MTHKEWIDNEYHQWIKALQESTVHNFKEHPMVKRMLGEPDPDTWAYQMKKHRTLSSVEWVRLEKIHQIGGNKSDENRGLSYRYIYYALEILKRNPSSICEIGGGVGQFYAILRALGYKGTYKICDKAEVIEFVNKYLAEVENKTGLNLNMGADGNMGSEMVVSFYALGEFDDETKQSYVSLLHFCKHGYIAWNSHSGASDDLRIFGKRYITVTAGIEPGVKIIEW